MQSTDQPSSRAEISSRFSSPSLAASSAVIAGPASAPTVPPAAMNPNSRCAWRSLKISTMKLQNTETTNRLNTLNQMKKALAAQAPAHF